MTDHIAVIEPDSRGRFNLRKFVGNVPGAHYRVYVDHEAGRVVLERIED